MYVASFLPNLYVSTDDAQTDAQATPVLTRSREKAFYMQHTHAHNQSTSPPSLTYLAPYSTSYERRHGYATPTVVSAALSQTAPLLAPILVLDVELLAPPPPICASHSPLPVLP